MNPSVQPPEKHKKKDYWTSSRHNAGCYGAALFWLLSMMNILSHDWFASAVMGYVAGILYYSTVLVLPAKYQKALGMPQKQTNVPIETSAVLNDAQNQTTSHKVTPETPPVAPYSSQMHTAVSPAEHLMAEFDQLYVRAKPKLPLVAQEKFQDIHDLLNLMVHKINRTQHVGSQLDMLNIQRVINHYIIPLIENYEDLPSFLLDRKKDNALSPNEMLVGQLNLIHDEVLKITEHVFQNNLEALSVHGDFLKHKLTPQEFFKVE